MIRLRSIRGRVLASGSSPRGISLTDSTSIRDSRRLRRPGSNLSGTSRSGWQGFSRRGWLLFATLLLSLLLSACGSKSAEDVEAALSKTLEKMQSYQATGVMSVQSGESPQSYHVEVWYKKPHYYRVSLSNPEKDITQIILRNDEGVFVMTPAINKSFRFQSDWPASNPQPYLYQSIVDDILKDREPGFEREGDKYLFQTQANYQNRTLARQRVWLNAKDYTPVKVEALDTNGNVLVTMDYEAFEMNAPFDEDAFDMERNMTSWDLESVPTATEEEEEANNRSFGIIRPQYVPEGVQLKEEAAIEEDERPLVILKYTGDYEYTLTEQRPTETVVSLPYGEPVDLGFTIGVLMDGEMRTMHWTYEGVDYLLTGNLPVEEMIRVAQSVEGITGK